MHDPVWVRKPKVTKDPLFSTRQGRPTIFDEGKGYGKVDHIMFTDESLDKATRLKTFKLESLQRLNRSNERMREQ